MKKLIILLIPVLLFLLVGCKKVDNEVQVKVIDYLEEVVVVNSKRKVDYYLIVEDGESNVFKVKVKKTPFVDIEREFKIGDIIVVEKKVLLKVIK